MIGSTVDGKPCVTAEATASSPSVCRREQRQLKKRQMRGRRAMIGIALVGLFGCDLAAEFSGRADEAGDAAVVHPVEVLEGCATPSISPSAHTFYVDPVKGDMKNDGSSASPWRTVEEVIKAGLIATQRYTQPYQAGAALVPENAKGVVKAGDLIYLRSGEHGALNLFGAVNTDFITIAAEEGQTPVVSNVRLGGASKWIIKGLTVQNTKVRLVDFVFHGFQGPTDNIVFERNRVLSQPDVSAWTAQDWVKDGALYGIFSQATCVTIRDNELRNIRNGMGISGDRTLIEGNVIDNFGDDGIDIAASRLALRGNRITNNHKLPDGNHNDGIQGWTTNGAINRDVVIDGNLVIQSTDPALPFAGDMQGISVFDGKWENFQVTNNVVIANAWHGITISGMHGAIITNNTVVGNKPSITTWISVGNMKKDVGGAPPENVVVNNNIATRFSFAKWGVDAHHNLTVGDPEDLFVTFDIAHARYDLHLSPKSRARGAGSPEYAPPTDISGQPRMSPIDAGAFASMDVR